MRRLAGPSAEDAAILPLPGVLPRPAGDDSWLPFLARRPGWVVAGGAALLAAWASARAASTYDHNLLHLQAQNLDRCTGR